MYLRARARSARRSPRVSGGLEDGARVMDVNEMLDDQEGDFSNELASLRGQ
jgi:hypothetical protein